MRSSIPRTLRQLSRCTSKPQPRQRIVSGARWSSSSPSQDGHQWSTPLAKQLAEAITTTGPIPVASFMRQCLTSDLGGYYTSDTSERDQFGTKGDFVTSPEISQIFGELVGVWIVAEWIAQGRRGEGVYLMEVGPGRGTLMDDVLRTIRNFPPLAKAIETVYLVESSPNLREAQHKLLCGNNELKQNDVGYESTSKHSAELKIVWTEDLRLLPPHSAGKTPFILAHEFFDALPIHVFQSVPPPPSPPSPSASEGEIQTPTGPIPSAALGGRRRVEKGNQWRELVVSPTPPHRLNPDTPEFELTMAKAATPHSMYLPETSPRYKALKAMDGATVEISPESQAYAREFAVRIGGPNNPKVPAKSPEIGEGVEAKGAALIIDYGPRDTIPTNSLRGIKQHERVSPFHSPGTTDISADVDFLSLAETAIAASPNVEVHGPVDQARFLTAMGIQERAAQLVKMAVDAERGGGGKGEKGDLTELVKRIETGWKRLVDMGPQGMGRLYQVLAIVPYKGTKAGEVRRRPVGFGGDVVV